MIRVGIVGFGFMGRMHFKCWNAIPGVKITAICEGNPEALKTAVAGNVAGAADAIDLSGIATFTNYDEFLAAGVVDAISITLPTFLHCDFSCKALEKGVHVLCEKPMALSLDECDRMIAASNKSGKVLQIGHCIRFWPEYSKAREIVLGGEYGKVIAAGFQRLGALPSWNPVNWFADEKRSGGMPLDLHIHDTDYVQHLFGLPKSVFCSSDSTRMHSHTIYVYEAGPSIAAEGSWRMASTFGFEMSFNIVLENATLVFDITRKPSFQVCPKEGKAFSPDVATGDGYSRQIEHFAKRVNGEKVEDVLTLEQSRNSVRIVLAEKESAARLEPVKL